MALPLEPRVAARCPACEDAGEEPVCERDEIAAQAERALRFHRARLASRRARELDERASFTQAYATALVACRGCGTLLRSPRPPADAVGAAYEDDEYPEDRLAEMRAAQVACFRRKLPVLRRLLGTPRRVIEVGSFLGGFLEVARTAGWPALGLDPGRQVAAECRALGLDVEPCTLEDWAGSGRVEPADCVAIWNTFDQLPDPHPALAAAARIVRPGGVLALRFPHGRAFRRLHARSRGARGPARRLWEACLAWNNLLGFPYLHGYGLDATDRLLTRYGFRRAAAHGDVLCLLAGRATASWARREERAVKQLQRLWMTGAARKRRDALADAPWLDVYYRREPGAGARPPGPGA